MILMILISDGELPNPLPNLHSTLSHSALCMLHSSFSGISFQVVVSPN